MGAKTFSYFMDRTLKCDHSLESCGEVLYCGASFVIFEHLAVARIKGQSLCQSKTSVRQVRYNCKYHIVQFRNGFDGFIFP